jgi:hypothetical protein
MRAGDGGECPEWGVALWKTRGDFAEEPRRGLETGSAGQRGRELGLGRPGRRGDALGGVDLLLSRSGSRAGAFLPWPLEPPLL